jgi:hypothetical protein
MFIENNNLLPINSSTLMLVLFWKEICSPFILSFLKLKQVNLIEKLSHAMTEQESCTCFRQKLNN